MKKENQITREEARLQCARLQTVPIISPQTKEAKTEIVNCLMRNCVDQAHAERAMTMVIEDCRDPKNISAELKAAAAATHLVEVAPAGCSLCARGVDDASGSPLYENYPRAGVGKAGYTFAARCTCVRGRWLVEQGERRKRETERAAAASSGTGTGMSKAAD